LSAGFTIGNFHANLDLRGLTDRGLLRYSDCYGKAVGCKDGFAVVQFPNFGIVSRIWNRKNPELGRLDLQIYGAVTLDEMFEVVLVDAGIELCFRDLHRFMGWFDVTVEALQVVNDHLSFDVHQ